MKLIIIHQNNNSASNTGSHLLRFGISNETVANVIFDGLSKNLQLNGKRNVVLAIPEKWVVKSCPTPAKIEYYDKDIPFPSEDLRPAKQNGWFVISNGRFVTQINNDLLYKALAGLRADVIAVNVEPQLLPYREKVRLTARSKVAGFRRLYSDSSQPAPFPADWPHHIFIKTSVLEHILPAHTLPQSFSAFTKRCRSYPLTLRAITVAGTVLDLDTEQGLLAFVAAKLNSSQQKQSNAKNKSRKKNLLSNKVKISDGARLFGKVLFGKNVTIGQNAIIVGPTIIGSNVEIAKGAVIRTSIVGAGVSVPRNYLVQNRVLNGSQHRQKKAGQIKTDRLTSYTNAAVIYKNPSENDFRTWPKISYAGCFKRVVDIAVSVIVLFLFAPVFPIIALIIKLTSPGSVYFKDTRQGLHGREFNCLKFRTMHVGADKIQEKLRVLNQADGPQFKMTNDPRISAVGQFLRDTYIDEIPQFFNVLLGQMSIVGPRPSPEAENTLCPSWRDARLSVRPGITGLWQVCRTRQPMKDFQEWIYYDTKYVRKLSLKMDLWICWQTLKKMVKNFITRF